MINIFPISEPSFSEDQTQLNPKLRHQPVKSPLMNFSQPTLVDGQLYVPSEWCEKMKDRTMCMCDDKHDTVVSDINDVGLTSDLALLVDYYTEGVLLPIICAVGICGKI